MSENTTFVKPTYFELFTKVLNELSYREVSNFSAIEKPEHKRILNLINAANSEVLSSNSWNFMIEKKDVTLKADSSYIMENFEGKVISLYEGSTKYKFCPPSLDFSKTPPINNIFTVSNGKIITKPQAHKREFSIIFTDNKFALNRDGKKQTHMTQADDTSIIPMPHLEPVLVYGTLIKVKANPSFVKFNFWRTMYINSLSTLRSRDSGYEGYAPQIRIY